MPYLNKIIIKIIAIALCFLLGNCHSTKQTVETTILAAQLKRVVSGQTIEVIIPEYDRNSQQIQRVRIIGIDVPKLENKSLREQATTRLKKLLFDNVVDLEIESNEPDSYNRILAHVWHNNLLVSEQLAQEGYVIANTKYAHKYSDRIFYAQEYARILNNGIWKY